MEDYIGEGPGQPKNDGGSAFPLGANEYAGHGPVKGMTLRDYFAAKAMQGFMSRTLIPGFDDEMICERSYQIADAMITAKAMIAEHDK